MTPADLLATPSAIVELHPEQNPLLAVDGLREAQVLDVRVDAATGRVGVLLESRMATQLDGAVAGLLIADGVHDHSWQTEPRSTARTAWNIVSSTLAGDDADGLHLSIGCLPAATLELRCRALWYVGLAIDALSDVPPDYGDPPEVVEAQLPQWHLPAEVTTAATVTAASLGSHAGEPAPSAPRIADAPADGARPAERARVPRAERRLTPADEQALRRLDEGLYQVTAGAHGANVAVFADTTSFLDDYGRRGATLFHTAEHRWQLAVQRRDEKLEVLVEFLSHRVAFDWFYRFTAGFGTDATDFRVGAVARRSIDDLAKPDRSDDSAASWHRVVADHGDIVLPSPAEVGSDWAQALVGPGAVVLASRPIDELGVEGLQSSVVDDFVTWHIPPQPDAVDLIPSLSGRVALSGTSRIDGGAAFVPVATFARAAGAELLRWELLGAPGLDQVELPSPTHDPHALVAPTDTGRARVRAAADVADRALERLGDDHRIEIGEHDDAITVSLARRGYTLRSDGLWAATHTHGPGQLVAAVEWAVDALVAARVEPVGVTLRSGLERFADRTDAPTAFERAAARLATELEHRGAGTAVITRDEANFTSPLGTVRVRSTPWFDAHVRRDGDELFATRTRSAAELFAIVRALVVPGANAHHLAGAPVA